MTIEEMFQKLSEQISSLANKVDNLENKVDNLEKGQNDLRDDVTAIKVDIENHVEPMLCELSGRVVDSSKRIMMIESKAEAYDDEKEIDKVIAEIKQKGMM